MCASSQAWRQRQTHIEQELCPTFSENNLMLHFWCSSCFSRLQKKNKTKNPWALRSQRITATMFPIKRLKALRNETWAPNAFRIFIYFSQWFWSSLITLVLLLMVSAICNRMENDVFPLMVCFWGNALLKTLNMLQAHLIKSQLGA